MSVIHSQNFDYADLTAFSTFGWATTSDGAPVIKSNRLSFSPSHQYNAWYATADANSGNVQATVSFIPSSSAMQAGGLTFRGNGSAGVDRDVLLLYCVYLDRLNQKLVISKVTPAVTETELASLSVTHAYNTYYVHGSVETVGGNAVLSASVQRESDSQWIQADGTWGATQVIALTYTDSSSPIIGAGKHGCFCSCGSSGLAFIDNYLLETYADVDSGLLNYGSDSGLLNY